MKGLLGMAAGVIVSASIIAVAQAAPVPNAGSDAVNHKHGMQNAKKAQQSKMESDKKVRAVKKRAHSMRQQSRKEREPAIEEAKATKSAM